MHEGPLSGVRVLEVAGLGPAPFAAMVLGDLGAEVWRLDRPGGNTGGVALPAEADWMNRNRRNLAVDLKSPEGVAVALELAAAADVMIEGFRPGVVERLGIGPDACLGRNPRLVYGRMTGWGQNGPWAQRAGHDLTYLALTGALAAMGPPDAPPPVPLNLVADFGGGGQVLATGILAALVERATSGRGQVVDAAMVDGVAAQTTMVHGFRALGAWQDERGANLLDGGAPFYRCYTCADGRFVAVGALEPPFFAALCAGLGIDPAEVPQHDPAAWPAQTERFAAVFASRSRDEWAEVFEGTDACVAPVLTMAEAPDHPHLAARGTFTTVEGRTQPAPAPRFSRTPAGDIRLPVTVDADTDAVLTEVGLSAARIAELRAAGVIA